MERPDRAAPATGVDRPPATGAPGGADPAGAASSPAGGGRSGGTVGRNGAGPITGAAVRAEAHDDAPAVRRVRVITTQEAIDPDRLAGCAVVVVDVLLATTTLIAILENGARRVFAAGDLADADRICGGLAPGALIRGGEQMALPVAGFDCGAYPHEYGPEVVGAKDVVYVSTNGTRAIARAEPHSSRLLVGNLRNGPAVARCLGGLPERDVVLVCAGSRGGFSLEDFAAAGVILSHLGVEGRALNDAGWLALDLVGRGPDRVPEILRGSRAGRWFVDNRQTEVLDYAGDVGASATVAEVRGAELLRVPAGDA